MISLEALQSWLEDELRRVRGEGEDEYGPRAVVLRAALGLLPRLYDAEELCRAVQLWGRGTRHATEQTAMQQALQIQAIIEKIKSSYTWEIWREIWGEWGALPQRIEGPFTSQEAALGRRLELAKHGPCNAIYRVVLIGSGEERSLLERRRILRGG